MKTRSRRAQQEQAGIPPTPPQQLPTARPTRARRNIRSTASPDIASDASIANSHPDPTLSAARPSRVNTGRGRKRKEVDTLGEPRNGIVTAQENLDSDSVGREAKREILDSLLNPPICGLSPGQEPSESCPYPQDTAVAGSYKRPESPLVPCPVARRGFAIIAPPEPAVTQFSPHTPDREMRKEAAFQEQIFNFPGIKEVCKTHTIMNLVINEEFRCLLLDGELSDPLSIAIPTEMLPDVLRFIACHLTARETSLQHLLKDDEFIGKLKKRLMNLDFTVNGPAPSPRKRKLSPDLTTESPAPPVTQEPTARPNTKTRPSRLRQASVRKAMSSPRKALQENDTQKNVQPGQVDDRPTKRTKLVPQLYNEQGMLTLGAYKEVPVDGEARDEAVDNVIEEQTHRENDNGNKDTAAVEEDEQSAPSQAPETPRSFSWGLKSFLPSVSRFIPSFRSPAKVEKSTPEPVTSDTVQQVPKTEPHSRPNQTTEIRAPGTSRPLQRRRESTTKHQLLTKGEKEIIRKQKDEIRRLKAELEKQKHKSPSSNSEDMIHEDDGSEPPQISPVVVMRRARQEAAMLAAQQADQVARKQAEEAAQKEAQVTGAKRKRSLDVIPNPEGGGYGMDLQYFGLDSDEETFLEIEKTPTQKASNKKARLSNSGKDVIGDPRHAKPYSGTLFALPEDQTSKPLHSNSFIAQDLSDARERTNGQDESTYATMTFSVPSPSDSDDSDDEVVTDGPPATPTPQPSTSRLLTTNQTASSQEKTTASSPAVISQSPAATNVLPNTLQQSIESAALDKARQTALKHQPMQPSRLREASRLSTSTVASSVETSETTEPTSEFASFVHFQQLIPDRVKEAIQMESAKATSSNKAIVFEEAFAQWGIQQKSRFAAFEAEISRQSKDYAADRKVINQIQEAWITNTTALSPKANETHASAIGSFGKSLGSWIERSNTGPVLSAFAA